MARKRASKIACRLRLKSHRAREIDRRYVKAVRRKPEDTVMTQSRPSLDFTPLT